jgi:hypothetical protein
MPGDGTGRNRLLLTGLIKRKAGLVRSGGDIAAGLVAIVVLWRALRLDDLDALFELQDLLELAVVLRLTDEELHDYQLLMECLRAKRFVQTRCRSPECQFPSETVVKNAVTFSISSETLLNQLLRLEGFGISLKCSG